MELVKGVLPVLEEITDPALLLFALEKAKGVLEDRASFMLILDPMVGGLGAPRGVIGVEGLDRAASQWSTAHGGPGKGLPSQLVGGVAGGDLVLPVQHLGHDPRLLLRAASHLPSFSEHKSKV